MTHDEAAKEAIRLVQEVNERNYQAQQIQNMVHLQNQYAQSQYSQLQQGYNQLSTGGNLGIVGQAQAQATYPKGPSLEFVFDMVMAGVEKNLRRIIREELAKDRDDDIARLASQSGEV